MNFLGPIPNIYPFIVNDPGEGAQAKRRTSAVIIDHLMPPLVRAELHGEHARLEALIDEISSAMAGDPRRLDVLTRDLLEAAARIGLDADCGIAATDPAPTRLAKLDAYLCDLKELQIRGGLHVLGEAPSGTERARTLIALARTPRGGEDARDASLIRALALDLALGAEFDPLDCDMATPWTGPRPVALKQAWTSSPSASPPLAPWRTNGDTRERLEALAQALVSRTIQPDATWSRTAAVLSEITTRIAPALDHSAEREIGAVLAALDGRFIAPGPSGAPSRPSRRAPHRAQFLLRRCTFCAHHCRMGTWPPLSGTRGHPLSARQRRVATSHDPIMLGHREHADRWR